MGTTSGQPLVRVSGEFRGVSHVLAGPSYTKKGRHRAAPPLGIGIVYLFFFPFECGTVTSTVSVALLPASSVASTVIV